MACVKLFRNDGVSTSVNEKFTVSIDAVDLKDLKQSLNIINLVSEKPLFLRIGQ